MPEDTSKLAPGFFAPLFAGTPATADRHSNLIEQMEADGQKQLLAEQDTIPTRGSLALIALGFAVGDADPHDSLFCTATFPQGWSKKATEHSMWTSIVDDLGRERVAMFYKAAYYDRSAFCRVNSVDAYVNRVAHENGTLVFDDVWATRNAVIEAVRENIQDIESTIARWFERIEQEPHRKAHYQAYIADDKKLLIPWLALLDQATADE